jgi:hypothetical protein
MSDRRKFARVPLDAPQFVSLRFADSPPETVLVVDLGRGGLQLSFAPTRNILGENLLGREAFVGGLPAALLGGDGKVLAGTVSWVSPQRCGIRFHFPLAVSEAELAILLAAL